MRGWVTGDLINFHGAIFTKQLWAAYYLELGATYIKSGEQIDESSLLSEALFRLQTCCFFLNTELL